MKYFQNKPAFKVSVKSNRPAIAIVCKKCDTEHVSSDKIQCPPEVILKHFADDGWKIIGDGSSALCPDCQKKKSGDADRAVDEAVVNAELERQRQAEERRQEAKKIDGHPAVRRREGSMTTKQETQLQTPQLSTPAAPVPDDQSEEAIIARSKVDALLREHCTRVGEGADKRAKYDKDWSDERISRDTGMSLQVVQRIRAVLYGKLGDPRFDALEAEIARVTSTLEGEIGAALSVVAGLKEQLANAEGEVNAVKERVTTTLAKLGRDLVAARAKA